MKERFTSVIHNQFLMLILIIAFWVICAQAFGELLLSQVPHPWWHATLMGLALVSVALWCTRRGYLPPEVNLAQAIMKFSLHAGPKRFALRALVGVIMGGAALFLFVWINSLIAPHTPNPALREFLFWPIHIVVAIGGLILVVSLVRALFSPPQHPSGTHPRNREQGSA